MITTGIREFIEEQSKYKWLLVALYQSRNQGGVTFPAAVELCNKSSKKDNGEVLLDNFVRRNRMGVEMEGAVVLDPSLRDFYERILENSHSFDAESVGRIRSEIERLCSEWESAVDARDKRYLIGELYRVLDRIPSSLEQGVGDLVRLTDEEYKAAISFQLKKAKLVTILDRVAELHGLLDESHALLSDDTHRLRTIVMADPEVETRMLETVLRRAKSQTAVSSQALVELTRRLQEYIAKVERTSKLVKRVRFVAKKIAQGTLETETNFTDVIDTYEEIGIKGNTYNMSSSHFDVEDIIENGRYVNLLVAIRDGSMPGSRKMEETPIDISALPSIPDKNAAPFDPNYKRLMRSFCAQGTDLFSFLIDYDFKMEITHDRRLALFLYMSTAVQFSGMLDHTDRTGIFEYVSDIDGRHLIAQYEIIKPK